MTCADPIEPIYYRKGNFDNVCAWCKKPLSEESVQKLQLALTTHSTVRPNCGEQGCLRRNVGGSDGWTMKRLKKPKMPKTKPNPKLKPKTKPNAKVKKRKNPPLRQSFGEETKGRKLTAQHLSFKSVTLFTIINQCTIIVPTFYSTFWAK